MKRAGYDVFTYIHTIMDVFIGVLTKFSYCNSTQYTVWCEILVGRIFGRLLKLWDLVDFTDNTVVLLRSV